MERKRVIATALLDHMGFGWAVDLVAPNRPPTIDAEALVNAGLTWVLQAAVIAEGVHAGQGEA